MKTTILVVDDEPSLVAMLRYNLERHDFAVAEAVSGEQALAIAERSAPSAVLLDWMLPKMSGIDVCRELRRQPRTRRIPAIMLTARDGEGDRVLGLNVGADDVIAKPFSVVELVARLKALLRRTQADAPRRLLVCGDIRLDLEGRKISRAGRPIHLGPTEFRMLTHFMEHLGRAFSREELLKAVWGADIFVELRTIDVHIRLLRRALTVGGAAAPIRTVRSVGYALDLS